MKMAGDTNFQIILEALAEFGLLLESDAKLPSVSSLVAGEPVRGSWWGHARAKLIFSVLQQLADHRDVLMTRLVSRKVTFAHRRLWSDVVTIGRAREPWQMKKLSSAAQMVLQLVDQNGSLVTNALEWPAKFKSVKPGEAVRELERRLLIHSEEFHTDSGAHAKQVETWEHWANRRGFRVRQLQPEAAKERVETTINSLTARFGATANLPWAKT